LEGLDVSAHRDFQSSLRTACDPFRRKIKVFWSQIQAYLNAFRPPPVHSAGVPTPRQWRPV
jgi:hypothetical protein